MILLLATFLKLTTNFYSNFFFSVYLLFLSHKAIECGDVSAVKQWLEEEETRVNDCKGGSASHGHFFVGDGTALHWAAYYGQLEIAKLLLNNGAGICNRLLAVVKIKPKPTTDKILAKHLISIVCEVTKS